jgi:anti-anti-sigma regulatory factor
MFASSSSLAQDVPCFAHREACRVFDRAVDAPDLRTVVIDMSGVAEATTSAFARLVLLRRELRRHGRDLRITGLRDRAAKLYEISKLDMVLPRC